MMKEIQTLVLHEERRTQPKIILTKMTILLRRTSGTAGAIAKKSHISRSTHTSSCNESTHHQYTSVNVYECVDARTQKIHLCRGRAALRRNGTSRSREKENEERRTAQVLRRQQKTNKLVAERRFAHIRVRQYGRANAICSMPAKLYTYTHTQREREREREKHIRGASAFLSLSKHTHTHIYIFSVHILFP